MKKRVLTFSIAACFLGLILSSYEHGPAYEGGLNRTGSQGGAANCAGGGCHASNAATTIVSVTVTTGTGMAVSSYTPGTTYDVTIRGHNTAAAVSLDEFGFQVSAVLSSSLQAGTFAVPSGANMRVTSLSGLQIVEHKDALHDSATNYSVAHFTWTAPAAGSGTVEFYGILNALGGGSGSSGGGGGEYPNIAPVVALSEQGGSTSSVNNVSSTERTVLFPNPCTNELNIIQQGTYAVSIFAANGIQMYSNNAATSTNTISMRDMPAGIYYVQISTGNTSVVKAVIKN